MTRRYTREQLLHLRSSPLVSKPDDLPAIEQWMEYVYLETKDGGRERLRIPHSEAGNSNSNSNGATHSNDQHGRHHHSNSQSYGQKGDAQKENGGRIGVGGARATRPGLTTAVSGAEDSPMGSFSTGQRPNLLQMRSKTGGADDLTLGPPRTQFPSSRNVTKLSDFHDRTGSVGEAGLGEEQDSVRSRFFADRQLNRRSTNDKDGADSRGSWTAIRDRKAGEQEDSRGDGRDRGGRYDRDHDGERRNGHSEKYESRWGSSRDEKRTNGERTGGWREREQQRRERDTYRGNEKDPEWMDEPAVQKEKDLGMKAPRTAEEFEKWKEAMRSGSKPQPEKDAEAPAATSTAAETSPAAESKPVKASLKLEGFEGGMFGGWTAPSSSTPPQNGGAAPLAAKSAGAAPRASRFASMFKPAEEPAPAPASEVKAAAPVNSVTGKTSAEEREGFDRVLAMLGGTKLGGGGTPGPMTLPTSPPPQETARAKYVGVNGEKQKPKSRFFNPAEPEALQSPPQGVAIPSDRQSQIPSDESSQFGGRLPDRHSSEQHVSRSSISENVRQTDSPGPLNAFKESQQRPASGRVNELAFEPPARRAATPDDNIQNLLAQQRPKPQTTSSESQALLNLLTKNTANARPPSQQQPPSGMPAQREPSQLHRWFEGQEAAGSIDGMKQRLPQQPPGLFEDQIMRGFPPDAQRHEQQFHSMQGVSMAEQGQKRGPQRAPPGFFDESMLLAQHQQMPPGPSQQSRRQFQEGMPQQMQQQQHPSQHPDRRMPTHPNLPPMHNGPHQNYQEMMSPGGFPPPGFNPHMPRHPPGLNNIPNIFQAPPPPPPHPQGQPQPQQQGPPSHQQQNQQPGPPPQHMRDQRFVGFAQGANLPPPPPPPPGFNAGPGGLPMGFMGQGQGQGQSQQPQQQQQGQPMRQANGGGGGQMFDARFAAMR